MKDIDKYFADIMEKIDIEVNKMNIRSEEILKRGEKSLNQAEERLKKTKERIKKYNLKEGYSTNVNVNSEVDNLRNLYAIRNIVIVILMLALFLFGLFTFATIMDNKIDDLKSLTPVKQIEQPLKSKSPKDKKL